MPPRSVLPVRMSRVVVTGKRCSGKTTLAGRLGAILGIAVVHLDELFWQPGWVPMPPAQWQEVQRRLISSRPAWILDGHEDVDLMAPRLTAADTVILLDLPPRICLWRALRRRIMRPGREVAPGCPERLRLPSIAWLWLYQWRQRPKLVDALARYRGGQQVVVLKTPADVQRFLDEVQRQRANSGTR